MHKKVLLDKSIVDQLAFIREGHFTEKDGEGIPTLKLVGTIEGLIDVDNAAIDPNAMYPLTTKQLQDSIKVNQYQMQAIIHCLDLKNKPKRHTEIKQGAKSNPIHKYSTSVVEVVNKIMAQKGRDTFLKECENIYREHKLNNRKK